MAKWFVAAKRADFTKIGQEFGISPVLARIIRNRDIIEEEEIRRYLQGTIADMYDPGLLKDMDKAVDILLDKIKTGRPIRIIGDYDADGICSTFILHKGLLRAGATADTAIPHRMKDGYGLNEHLVDDAFQAGIDTIVTCDNGIAAAPQIEIAKEKGMTVIVTDHHEVPYEEAEGERRYILPPADAVIDPKQDGDEYPYNGICGAVVAYKVMEALYRKLELTQKEKPLLEELLELAAFATVCDVMELLDENRVIVKFGLSHMKNTANQGLRALMEVNGIEKGKLSAYHLGFVMGPCLNATGRLDTAVRALQLLEAEDRGEAVRIASDLKQLNDSRKEMTDIYVKKAIRTVEESGLMQDRVLVVYLPDCHESLAGIIAGRVREKYYKPVFVLTRGEEGVKGSGRSIETYHMYEEMTRIKHLFTKYGGHKMAAGLSLEEKDVESFRREINAVCTLTESDMEERVHIDVPMPVSHVSMEFVQELELLEPFGNGNPKPVFAQKDLSFLSARILGKNGNAVRFTVLDDCGTKWEMMAFGDPEPMNAYMDKKFGREAVERLYLGKSQDIRLSVTYYPSVNSYQGNTKLQLVMQQYQ
nr:single-stranded-DNA-specific exonuclease RecJ [uncultured Eisenbergiella sp.]